MKTSTFFTKVLNKFRNGKGFTSTPNALTWKNAYDSRLVTLRKKGQDNLLGMMTKVANENEIKTISKYKVALANSLGHTSVDAFAKSKNVKFSAVKAVLKAVIKNNRAIGN